MSRHGLTNGKRGGKHNDRRAGDGTGDAEDTYSAGKSGRQRVTRHDIVYSIVRAGANFGSPRVGAGSGYGAIEGVYKERCMARKEPPSNNRGERHTAIGQDLFPIPRVASR